MSVGLLDRVCGVSLETLEPHSPLNGIFVTFRPDSPPTFKEAIADLLDAIRAGLLDLSNPTRREEVFCRIEIAAAAAFQMAAETMRFDCKGSLLNRDQMAALHLYSQRTDQKDPDSLQTLINAVLRNKDRRKVNAIRRFLFLFLTAVEYCPSVENHVVYCGTFGNISSQYECDNVVVWHQISSCILSLDMLCSPTFLGTSGARTVFSIELGPNTRARRILDFSSDAAENEVILPPNTRFKVHPSPLNFFSPTIPLSHNP
jgi:hypothetical protein